MGVGQIVKSSTKNRHAAFLTCIAAACLLAACGGASATFSGSGSNTAPVALLMTATAPQGVDVLAFQVTLTNATLNNGSKQLIAAPVAVEVTRLQAETALLSTTNVTASTYSTLTLTYANPMLVFRNDTGGSISVWGANCAAGQICTATPAGAGAKLTGTVNLPGSSVTLTTGTPVALQLNFDFGTMLGNTAMADLTDNTSVSLATPATQGAPFATMEDVVGTVTSVNANQSSFTLQTGLGTYTMATTTAAAAPTVYTYPIAACATETFACVAAGQIVSVDMALQSTDGTLLAKRVLFEDTTSSEPEIEGVVLATTGLAPPAQFNMVVLQETPAVAGLPIGTVVQVAPNSAPPAIYYVDNLGASAVTNSYSFDSSHVIVGQELQVRMAGSSGTQINADQIRLRSSRFTALESTGAPPTFYVNMLPALYTPGGFSQIQVKADITQPPSASFTEYGGTAQNFTQISAGYFVTVRAQLFASGSTPTGVATKVLRLQHQ